jgi:IS5 family transposase
MLDSSSLILLKKLDTPARATQNNSTVLPCPGNLILPVPDTDFRDFLEEVEQLARVAPEIVRGIEKDLDAHAREKKRSRQEDRKFFESQTEDLPEWEIAQREIVSAKLTLEVGRPRMSGEMVYVFLMLRGFLGSLTSKPARRFLRESMSLHGFLQDRELKMPGWTTILENVNAVSASTRELILDKQIAYVLKEELDDFKELTIDSTAVKANSSWPTDGKILTGLLGRSYRLGQQLHVFGLKDFKKGWCPRWLDEMDKLEFQICLSAGKAKSRSKMKRHYRKLLKTGQKAIDALAPQLSELDAQLKMETLAPSRRELLTRGLNQIRGDLADARRVLEYCGERVFRDKKRPSTEKVLSLSDGSAAYIKKGGRDPVIGYKPQLVRSANGFVTSLIVPQGNAADSIKLEPAIRDSIRRTGVVAELVSTDDGYASAKGRDALRAMGVKTVSISGAKGKKLTDPEDWVGETCREARRNRSAVESLMFTIKDGFEFGEVGRRGIEAVRAELAEKVAAYNCCRIILLKQRREKRRRDEKKRAA